MSNDPQPRDELRPPASNEPPGVIAYSQPRIAGVTEADWLAAIVNAVDEAIMSIDLGGTIRSWNPGAERLFGYLAREVAGHPVTILIPPDRAEEESAILTRIRRGEKVDRYETVRRRKDGSLVEVSLMVSPVSDTNGNVVGASKIVRELTDRRVAETANRQLAAIIDSSDDAIISKSLDGVIQSWNRGAELLFGYTAAEAIGRPVTMLIPLGRQEEEPQILARLRRGEKVDHYETVRRRKDGKLIEVSLTVSPIHNALGHVIGASKIVRDLSDRKKSDQSARYLAAIVESSDDAIISKSLQGVIQSWNTAAERLFGYTAAEAVGQRILMLIPEGRHDEEPSILGRLRRGERIDHYETIRRRKDGALIEVSLTVSPIRGANGEIIGASKIVRDISAQKRVLRELQEAHEKALAANRAKDDFLAALSHELRTPLNPVLLIASERALDASLPESVREDFECVRRNVELEARLIDDLLDLSRIANGRLLLQIGTHDLRGILNEAITKVESDLMAKKQVLSINVGAGPIAVSGDPVRLQQVLWNVLKNAVKFTPEEGRITISTRINTVRTCAVLEVADTGRGLAPDELESIFDAFAAATPGKKAHQFGGLGLGLTISRKIAELHHGSISARSAGPGHGATFVIEIPLARIEDGVERFAQEARASAEREHSDEGAPKVRVLLIEDHEASRAVLMRLLSRRGYDVVGAGSVEEARAIAGSERISFAISDVGLPDGDGAELITELQQRYRVPSIALTGYGMEDDIRRCRDAGALAHLTKPVSTVALAQALATEGLPQLTLAGR